MVEHICTKETEIALQGKDIKYMKDKIDHIDGKIDNLITSFNAFQGSYIKDKEHMEEKFDKKYASKFTEKAIIWVITLVIGAVIYNILSVIGIK